uniref:SpaH/EbpB family LPXTG-anchored major pilin n=1 Tax=Gemmiger formicilis TaxID=745368 RepID=UPI00402762B9
MKLKRLFTAVLSTALTLSLCAMPAMAADGSTATPPKTSTSTIDKGQLGSITIHKYLMDDTSKALPSTNGEKTNTLPDGALPASGVEFTLYQVKDIDELIQYFDGVSDAQKVEAKNYFNNENYKDGVTDAVAGKPTVHGETNKDGIVTFEKLPLGLYLVVETKKPVTVTEAVDPFLVSVPMTRIGEAGKTIPTEWLYDIHVYPKNSTSKGNVTLEKMGVVGDKTNAVPVKGVKFTLEMLTAGAAENDETNWNLIRNGTEPEFTTDDQGKIKAENLIPGKYRFTEVGYADDAPNKSYIINNGDTYVFDVDREGNVSKPENTNDYDAAEKTITVYNYRPDVNKQVKNRSNGYGDAADYNKDDTITYKVVVDVPANIVKLKKFVLTDTPTNLTDDSTSVKVYSDETMKSEVAPGSIYSVAGTDDKGFTITFTPDQMGTFAGEKLYVSYTATLKKDASGNFTGSTTVDGNSNSIVLTYSNKTNLNKDEAEDSNNQTKIKDEAVVYSFQLNVQKTNGKNNLPGVVFDLYKEGEVGAKGALDSDKAKKLGFENTERTGYVLVQKNLVTDDNGQIVYKGLANGNYWLVETKTLEGYNLLAKPVGVKLDIKYQTTLTEKTYENGVLIKSDVSATEKWFRDTTINDKTEDGKTIGGSAVTVVNRKGFTLPVTGGFGTLLFSGIGVLLVLAGVGVLFSLKKKSNRA